LSTPTYQTVPVTCPGCQHRFVAPVLTIIDAGQNPEAKPLFLSGQINIAVCPQCGYAGALNTPLVYHDPENELLFTFVPPELGLPETEQQRIIGDLTNRVMSALPTEGRKGYLLRPQSFLRLEAMIEAILEADGITREMIEAQRAQADLLDRLLRASSEEARQAIAQENDGRLDYEFFRLLALNIELSEAEGRSDITQQLLELRKQLLAWTTTGKDVAAREEAIKSLGSEVTREGLLEKLVEAALAGEQGTVETMVTLARPAIDYVFYQQLTARIEAAEKAAEVAEARVLTELRQTILELTAQIDAQVQHATEEATQLLQRILDSPDPEKLLRKNLEHMDELFLGVLGTNIQMAEQSGRTEEAEKLQRIGEMLTGIILESQPPEIQLINRLLAAEYPDGTQALLEENRPRIDAGFLDIMQLVGEDLSRNGREEAAQQLARIREQASTMVGQA
jgi:hypothetical protein